MKWQLIVIILCAYGFFKEFRPSEPYLYQYETTMQNLSDSVLESEVWPYWTYSYLISLIPVFLLTDVLLYKPVLMLESASYVATWSLLIWTSSVGSQQLMQVTYGWGTATEVAYYAYIYAAVDRSLYKAVTSYTRAAVQVGKCFSYALSQLIISTKIGDYQTLNYISLISVSIIIVFAVSLPSISWRSAMARIPSGTSNSIVCSEEDDNNSKTGEKEDTVNSSVTPTPQTYGEFVLLRLRDMKREFISIYDKPFIIKWSVWWAMATCGFFQIGNYAQTLWGQVQKGDQDVYNGLVEAANTATGAVTILLLQKLTVNWEKWGEPTLFIISLIDALLLITMGQTESIWLMYVCYMSFRVLYQAMITIAQYNLARKLVTESFGLVFGFNTFIALALQTVLTVVVADKRGFHLRIRDQFSVYSGYHAAIGCIFLTTYTVSRLRGNSARDETGANSSEADTKVLTKV